ncbi:MAG: endonuclease III domain-containing protein [Candidatus Omnitrophica bacterium]|nr:endonuclease III domain-containing protein [Candidatus Omnitrophota bacterium]MBU4303785.1 endonuclease III domain-containing protein [Candidatus Omnitrophota bacterium]MBU4419136.1 endonuclease III domain-containing protein [Candidatus Omnitrophota bacterium]MBU4468593.1 endonuclease III domain-containing protein [Candidatus Omnitrophota bacterium]MCG2708664.1 endonuclease III domain-containing protein [Candidatus Omnitrophota bacterium]
MKRKLKLIFKRLYAVFGAQHWWPADSVFEIMVGAILTQNTNWSNVQKAILMLKEKKLLTAPKLYALPQKQLAGLIKSAGYYNVKAARLKSFLKFFFDCYAAKIKLMGAQDLKTLRAQLLAVKGIGPETADSMLLYALNKPVFVVDTYTKRILSRHGLIKAETDYSQCQDIFMRNLNHDARLFGEYHALLVKLGKDYCRKQNPKCETCPLWSIENAW